MALLVEMAADRLASVVEQQQLVATGKLALVVGLAMGEVRLLEG